MIQSSYVDTYQ